jgi:hypothetical protein
LIVATRLESRLSTLTLWGKVVEHPWWKELTKFAGCLSRV